MANFKWCLVGNIVQSHTYGEEHEMRVGSKQFAPGAKVYIAPANWGDGYEDVIVIGCPRRCRHYIEIIMRSDLIENVRLKKVYAPFLLKMMDKSQYTCVQNRVVFHPAFVLGSARTASISALISSNVRSDVPFFCADSLISCIALKPRSA